MGYRREIMQRRLGKKDDVVKSIIMYGVEIWRYREWEGIEKLKKVYLKWVLGVERCTPDYIIRRETKESKIWEDAIFRAMKYEEKLDKISSGDIRKEIWIKKKKKLGIMNRYDREREDLWGKLELQGGNLSEEERGSIKWEAKRRLNEMTREEDLERIRDSRYAEGLKEFLYQEWEKEEVPVYLLEKKNIKTLARFRMGSEFEGCKFWKKEDDKMCRICKKGVELVRHVFEECDGMIGQLRQK